VCGITSAATIPKAKQSDDLRPAYATSADVAEGKRVADGLCARCHGATGISATSGVPHVAGQRPSYLYTKIKAYQSGARDDHAMESAVKFLNDDALVKVAAYYASLEPPPPAAAEATSKAQHRSTRWPQAKPLRPPARAATARPVSLRQQALRA
jgi:cytochrome c553